MEYFKVNTIVDKLAMETKKLPLFVGIVKRVTKSCPTRHVNSVKKIKNYY